MGSRERKRTERRKRKQRRADSPTPVPEATANGDVAAAAASPDEVGGGDAQAEARAVSRSELKNQAARENLEPLAAGERPLVVTLGAVVSAAIAAVTVGAWLAGAEVSGERPNAVQVFAPAILFGVMAWGMWRARYWAVLGFQAVMAILMVGSFLALISATSVAGALSPLAVFLVAGTFFWFTVKALARIQMPDRHLPK